MKLSKRILASAFLSIGLASQLSADTLTPETKNPDILWSEYQGLFGDNAVVMLPDTECSGSTRIALDLIPGRISSEGIDSVRAWAEPASNIPAFIIHVEQDHAQSVDRDFKYSSSLDDRVVDVTINCQKADDIALILNHGNVFFRDRRSTTSIKSSPKIPEKIKNAIHSPF